MNIRQRRQRQDAFKRLSKTDDGKLMLGYLYELCHIENPVVPGDQLSTGVNIGKELIGKKVRNILGQTIEETIEVKKEYNNRLLRVK